MKKLTLLLAAASLSAACALAQGGIDADMMGRLRASFGNTPADKALRNALGNNSIDVIATNSEPRPENTDHMTFRVRSRGITDQKSSGRCWLFTGLNVLRSQMMARHNLPELHLSQNYNFFFDQLEKSNLFLQSIIETASEPMSDRRVDWLFQNPLSDGGQYTGRSDLIMKYGVVPSEIMPETYNANNTSRLRQLISFKLRQDGLRLRKMVADKASKAQIEAEREKMLEGVYRMLALSLGVPPTEFTWTRRALDGTPLDTKTYTPLEFYRAFAGNDLKNDYVMLMNDPSRPYHKLYEIDLDRHAYDGQNWTYINLPMDEIKAIAVDALRDSTMMYFSCDVGKQFDRAGNILDVRNFDYASLMGTDFTMDKADRIRTHASASSHAMTLVGVDLDEQGRPARWLVENSWGPGANGGHLIITDPWMDEYMFRLVAPRRNVPKKTLEILRQKPTILPAWDPLFAPDL